MARSKDPKTDTMLQTIFQDSEESVSFDSGRKDERPDDSLEEAYDDETPNSGTDSLASKSSEKEEVKEPMPKKNGFERLQNNPAVTKLVNNEKIEENWRK